MFIYKTRCNDQKQSSAGCTFPIPLSRDIFFSSSIIVSSAFGADVVCLLIVFQLILNLHDLCTFGADVVIAVGHKCSLHCANLKHEFQTMQNM